MFEHRTLVGPLELRSDGAAQVVVGTAMRYGALSKPLTFRGRGIGRERFMPGSFTKTLQESDVRAHNEHDGPYLGRVKSQSLRLTDGPTELRFELDLPDTTAGRDAAYLIGRGDIRGSSVGFSALPKGQSWSMSEDGTLLRTVTEARLSVVDLTTAPAYDDSTAEMALRSLADFTSTGLDAVVAALETGELRSLFEVIDPEEGPPAAATFRPHMTSMTGKGSAADEH